ncbi:hypothetical protein GmHk_17G049338 [Glycine max]|nr:hypothetical protein GmHk_17G049338 [Glycine max]
MEFKYRAAQDRRTSSPLPYPLSTGTYVSDRPLRGGYPGNVPAPRVFRTPVPVNAGEAFRRELEKKQIRREILAREMTRRRELEEEVRREIAIERVLGIPFRERAWVSLNQDQGMNNPVNNNIFGGSQPSLSPQIDISRQQTNKDKFKYRDDQIQRTPSPLRHPLPSNTYVSNRPLQGCDFVSGGFPRNVSVPRVFLMAMPINVNEVFQRELEKEKIWRELEKEGIRREIIAREMTFAQQRELEDEVRKEIELERTFRISMQRSNGITFREPVSVSFNHSMGPLNNITMSGGLPFHLLSQASKQINKDKVIILNKPDDHCGEKRKAMTLAIDDNESLQKKSKKDWSCELCQISATSLKGLNDHIQGKKHKANKESTRTQKIGLDSRPESETLHPCLTPADTCKLESKEKGQVVQKGKGLGDLDDQNETTTSKQAQETSALSKGKKFEFWCELCQFKYRDGQIRRTPSPLRSPLPSNSYVSNRPLHGCDFASGGFPSNVSAPRVFPMVMPINVNEVFQRELEKEKIWRELEKEKIRREIIAREMAFAQRRELEDEVRKEMELERTSRMSMQRSEGIAFREPISESINQSRSNNITMFGGLPFHLSSQASKQIHTDNIQFDNKEASNSKDKNKPNDHCGEKRKAMTLAIDDNESLRKKAKKEWTCELCQISTTSEKGLNDHIQGKKHKANKESTRTQKIGLDSRPESETLHSCFTPADTCNLESEEKGQVVQNSKGLGDLDDQNKTTTSKQAHETSALSKGKKFEFWCELCQVQTQSEIVMQSHHNGKKTLEKYEEIESQQ